MPIQKFSNTANSNDAAHSSIIPRQDEIEQESRDFPKTAATAPCLTDILLALEVFQDFESPVREAAIAFCASEMGISQMHFYVLSFYAAGLGGVQ